ncbi:MAG TPA: hydroxymethylbilane synthase [Chloroflexota bacterium]|nr:hydroxymethylbilane synthase [Chloroflexota bacterium]
MLERQIAGSTGRTLNIGTRGSKLALAQTDLIRSAFQDIHPEIACTVTRITTKGDQVQDRPLSAIGDKGLFVGEIEQALRDGVIDLAVHSAKDLPSELPTDMALAAFPRRADPRDVLVTRDGSKLTKLASGSIVGTSSLRRLCQLRYLRPDLRIEDLRGNVDTRLRRLSEGGFDGIVLAAAGLERLGLVNQPVEYLSSFVMLPAVGQGALAIETRADDTGTIALMQGLDDAVTRVAVTAERAFLRRVSGGCQVPIAAFGYVERDQLTLTGLIGRTDGKFVRGNLFGSVGDAEDMGFRLAERLLDSGGRELLRGVEGISDV